MFKYYVHVLSMCHMLHSITSDDS